MKKYAVIEALYLLLVSGFCVALNRLNKILLALQSSGFDLLAYNNWQPMKFFVGALLLVVLGVGLCCHYWHQIRYQTLYGYAHLLFFAFILVNIVLIIFVFIFIDNPILRTVLLVGGIVSAFFSGETT